MFKSPHGAWEGTCTLCWAWPQQVRAARMVLYMTLASRLHPLSSSRGMQVSLLINCKNCDALTLILELMVVFIFLSPSLSAYLLSHNVLRSIMRPDFRYIAICAHVALRGEDIYGEPLNNTPPDVYCVFRWTVGFSERWMFKSYVGVRLHPSIRGVQPGEMMNPVSQAPSRYSLLLFCWLINYWLVKHIIDCTN